MFRVGGKVQESREDNEAEACNNGADEGVQGHT